ncbi:MAG: prepilin-type N-terminal cleavage/methylation domain-containing protein [Betaproteobacteria bacterium]|nr:MAG: prepilin-type N-terminal cleavage/methylation domain-containing protein [Betaproteobacteria bacterium]
MKSGRSSRGFTLLETLVVVVLIGTVALAAVPLLSSQNPTKLDVAAAEVGNALRFAIGEAERSGGCVYLDGSVPGHLRVYSSVGCASWAAVSDPLTKRALDLDTSGPAFSGQVSMAPKFFLGGTAYTRLLIVGFGTGPGTQLLVFDGLSTLGPLQAGSGVVLTLGPQSITVALNEITGLVTLP